MQQFIKLCVTSGLDYFTTKFGNDLSESVSAFKAAQLSLPWKVTETLPTAASVDELKAFPFLDDPTILTNLKSELSVYLATAAGVTPSTVTDAVLWLKNHSNELPHWSNSLKKVLLVQPSSASAERVFSLSKASFGPQQNNSLRICHHYRQLSEDDQAPSNDALRSASPTAPTTTGLSWTPSCASSPLTLSSRPFSVSWRPACRGLRSAWSPPCAL